MTETLVEPKPLLDDGSGSREPLAHIFHLPCQPEFGELVALCGWRKVVTQFASDDDECCVVCEDLAEAGPCPVCGG